MQDIRAHLFRRPFSTTQPYHHVTTRLWIRLIACNGSGSGLGGGSGGSCRSKFTLLI